MPSVNDKVLSYGDSCLRKGDADLLKHGQWLNDQVISFWFEYLVRDKYKDLVSSHQILLVPPSLTFILATVGSPQEASMLLETMQPDRAEVAVFAINDSNDIGAANSGFHWTVLAFERASKTFRHYDSAPGCSSASAQAARRTLLATKDALGVPSYSPDDIVEVQAMPRQQNGFDCGVFACCVTDMLCKWQAEAKRCEQQEPCMREALCREASNWRAGVQKLIGELQGRGS
uniref:Ubiquitin-like protease family profile domain-containing protein n=2 Tax=Dunaliella tertiolecta TaxID=3047 RepID=A0A6S8JRZ7_DUNTE